MTPALYVEHVNEDEHCALLLQTHRGGRAAKRASVILLSLRGMSAYEIGKHTGMGRNNVVRWIRRWNETRMDGLVDKPKTERPRKARDENDSLQGDMG